MRRNRLPKFPVLLASAHVDSLAVLGLLRVDGRPVEALTAVGVDPAALRSSLVEVLRQAS